MQLQIAVHFDFEDDDLAVQRLHRRLRAQLEELGDVQAVNESDDRHGARGVRSALSGVFTLLVPESAKVACTMLGKALSEFIRRSDRRIHVRLGDNEITIDRPDSAQVQTLLEHFVAQNSQFVDTEEQ